MPGERGLPVRATGRKHHEKDTFFNPVFLIALLVIPTVQTGWGQSDEKTQLLRIVEELGSDLKQLEKSHENFRIAALKLDSLFDSLSKKVKEVGQLTLIGGDTSTLMQATKEMQEMNQSFNLQYLGLQKNMQEENRQFTMVSNIMKTKHDTAKNAINNVR